jgi:hypothetical protein
MNSQGPDPSFSRRQLKKKKKKKWTYDGIVSELTKSRTCACFALNNCEKKNCNIRLGTRLDTAYVVVLGRLYSPFVPLFLLLLLLLFFDVCVLVFFFCGKVGKELDSDKRVVLIYFI